ncbi:MAG: hypothetical protein Q8P15_00685 [Nanoarchaeota archaeon]|nr:hypothetical protein [Nanoarchaeota archaeon]
MAINISILTILVGVIGILFGSLISPYLNHKLTQRYQQRDLFFKKKIEYFEKIVENIEKNIRLYRLSIKKINGKNEIKELIENMKKERKNFLVLTSPIYLQRINLSNYIRNFTEIEGEIFNEFNKLENQKENKEQIIIILKEKLESLKKSGNKIIFEMKREINKDIK